MKFFEKKVEEKHPIDKEIDSVLESLKSYSADTEEYRNAMGSLERLVALKKELYGDDKKSLKDGFFKVTGRIFETLTDARLVAAAVTSVVYVWWGKTCMRYDEEGHIPPTRMLGNGPKPPKQGL